jgi:hypothetical protein
MSISRVATRNIFNVQFSTKNYKACKETGNCDLAIEIIAKGTRC